jgi:hypothetical protein
MHFLRTRTDRDENMRASRIFRSFGKCSVMTDLKFSARGHPEALLREHLSTGTPSDHSCQLLSKNRRLASSSDDAHDIVAHKDDGKVKLCNHTSVSMSLKTCMKSWRHPWVMLSLQMILRRQQKLRRICLAVKRF